MHTVRNLSGPVMPRPAGGSRKEGFLEEKT